ncbi:L-aminopeptidase/D-esterase [Natronincola peptidivorans]|uniref:L-aminopeptidase/D-esterase n=1 Tax=Natronincola peptidivorans TaxID=426128 RepID=A0A1I0AJC8_9FIRM|nr:P1 family peptidase [Natronincola peptidivorans]SES94321.1 L-aminopeptidase/D-esterase [Natronincola peptidivorans]
MQEISITAIEGIKIGHCQDLNAATGCTVVISEEGAIGGVDVRGGAPGTRETDLLNPMNLVEEVHAILLAGGSAFGLDAAAGVMEYLEEKKIGFDVGVTTVPIVAGAVLFDLTIGDPKTRPNKEMGYKACESASSQPVIEGTVGAGTGATVGKFLGAASAMKGGLGTYCVKAGDLIVGAIVAVNCLGDVMDPKTGKILAGALKPDKKSFANTEEIMLQQYSAKKNLFAGNTTIGAVITNGKLTKSQANKVASMAHNGYARTIRPAHTMMDGDTIFTLATGRIETDVSVVGLLGAKAMEEAVLRAVKKATSLAGVSSCKDIE